MEPTESNPKSEMHPKIAKMLAQCLIVYGGKTFDLMNSEPDVLNHLMHELHDDMGNMIIVHDLHKEGAEILLEPGVPLKHADLDEVMIGLGAALEVMSAVADFREQFNEEGDDNEQDTSTDTEPGRDGTDGDDRNDRDREPIDIRRIRRAHQN